MLAVMATAYANNTANGRMIQDGCALNGNAKYSTHAMVIIGSAAFLAR